MSTSLHFYLCEGCCGHRHHYFSVLNCFGFLGARSSFSHSPLFLHLHLSLSNPTSHQNLKDFFGNETTERASFLLIWRSLLKRMEEGERQREKRKEQGETEKERDEAKIQHLGPLNIYWKQWKMRREQPLPERKAPC